MKCLTSVKNLENQLYRQKQYSHRNCILIHGITETQDENTDDISLDRARYHTNRIGNSKSGNKRS